MRLLITGASGLIGRELSFISVDRGYDVYSSQHESVPEFGKPIQLNISDSNSIEKCFNLVKPEAVVHLAAFTNVDKCEETRDFALSSNAKSVEKIAKEASKHSCHLVYISTDYVFDGEKGMYGENDKPNPINWYGETKLRGEQGVRRYASSCCIARTSTPYGLHPKRKTFPVLLAERLYCNQEMQVVEDQFTSPTYIRNLARMLIEIVERRYQGVIHVSGSTCMSRFDLAKLVARKLFLNTNLIQPIKMNEINWRARRPRHSSLNVSKALSELTGKPEPIEQSLESFCAELLISRRSNYNKSC